MSDRYDQDASLPYDDGLDEYLCEYVDGTMDPAVRSAFEEYLHANPDLELHVERLRRTRMLCTSQRCAHAPSGLQHRLRMEIARDLMGNDGSAIYLPRLGHFAVLSSLVALAMLVGIVAGASIADRQVRVVVDDPPAGWVERPPIASDGHPSPASKPVKARRAGGFGVHAPVTTLPVLGSSDEVTPIGNHDSLSAAVALRAAD